MQKEQILSTSSSKKPLVMKKIITFLLLILLIVNYGQAQNVAINTDGSNASADAILHLKSTSQGLLIPSMTSGQRTAISNVSNGLMVYDTQTNSFWFRDAGTWNEIVSGDIDLSVLEDTDGNTQIQVEEGNDDDQIRFDIDGIEQFVIKENANGQLMLELTQTSGNTFLGESAGLNVMHTFPDGAFNSFFGRSAGRDNVSGSYNSYFGLSSGLVNTTGDWNTFSGAQTGLSLIAGNHNTMIGYSSGSALTSGDQNTFLGSGAGGLRTGGSDNTCIGYRAGRNTSSGGNNVYIGTLAGSQATGDDELYIDNSNTNSPLIYGDFSSNDLQCNGDFSINEPATINATSQFFFKINGTNRFSMGYETASSFFVIKDEVNNDRVLYINDGKVGIQRSSPSNDFEVNGTASKSSAGDWLANSDARLKKNITPMSSENVLQKLLQLKGVTYEWNDDKTGNDRPAGIQYGFTAQNIQAVYPELVSEDNFGYLQTAYGTYDAMYIESIRALLDKIENLENKLEKFENLEARLNRIEAANGLNSSK